MLETISNNSPAYWFGEHGLVFREEESRLYPYSNQASDVLNLLLYWLEKLNVKVITDCKVTDIFSKGQSYGVNCSDGKVFYGEAVICALGGSAGPQFGTDGFGPRFAKLCGCKTEPLYPCLVPLKCDKSQISGLSGIRVKANASLLFDGVIFHTERGEIQFTDYGLSGIAVMQLSGFLSPKRKTRSCEISLDLFPHMSHSELTQLLCFKAKLFANSPLSDIAVGLLNKRVFSSVLKGLQIGKNTANALSEEDISLIANALKNWRFTNLEAMGWQQAQTTGGGISLYQINSSDFSLIGCDGLYFVGETLDCAGFCGGFNLHWAFGSGIAAGKSCAEYVKNSSQGRKKR